MKCIVKMYLQLIIFSNKCTTTVSICVVRPIREHYRIYNVASSVFQFVSIIIWFSIKYQFDGAEDLFYRFIP